MATQYEYDFAFSILLVTGIFDNLAWLICKIYEIELSKMDIKLIIPDEEKKRKFIKAVEEKCSCLSDFLSMELTQAKISLVYPIRDTVVHLSFWEMKLSQYIFSSYVLQRQNSPLTMYIHFGYTIIERG